MYESKRYEESLVMKNDIVKMITNHFFALQTHKHKAQISNSIVCYATLPLSRSTATDVVLSFVRPKRKVVGRINFKFGGNILRYTRNC